MSPPSRTGGVGFDINCGVRLLRTNLMESDVNEVSGCLNVRTFLGCS